MHNYLDNPKLLIPTSSRKDVNDVKFNPKLRSLDFAAYNHLIINQLVSRKQGLSAIIDNCKFTDAIYSNRSSSE